MITFLNHITDRQALLCTKEQWDAMVGSQQNAEYIKMYRKALKKDEKSAVGFKQRLQAVNFQGYDVKVLNGGNGSRKAADMLPTGLFMLDIDHIDKPRKVYAELQSLITKKQLPEDDLALVHITPSGKGLRIVMRGAKGSTIEADQKWLADTLGVEHDLVTKDLSRWSFVPLESEILYINKDLLFASPFEDIYAANEQPQTQQEAAAGQLFSVEEMDEGETDAKSGRFPEDYNGIPYDEIVETYINFRGTPEPGERHKTLVELALDMRNICSFKVDWMMEIIPNLDKTRAEKRAVIQWAVNQTPRPCSKRFQRVMERLKKKYNVEEIDLDVLEAADKAEEKKEAERAAQEEKEKALQEGLDEMPQLPERMPSLIALLTQKVMPFQKAAVASMVFPPLQAHIQDAIFNADDESDFEMSGMCVLVGKQSVGKSCVDKPIECIMENIAFQDRDSRERERTWAAQQQNKKANEKGAERPHIVIRYLNSDITPASLIQRLYNAENYGERKNLFTYTKVDEIEELYSMAPTLGRSKISQLIKKCWDCGKIGAERFTANAANFEAQLRWNWTACGTIEKVVGFFAKSLVDGTLSRVDFATIIPPEGKFTFRYGKYDNEFKKALKPYIENLEKFKCEEQADGERVPFMIEQLSELSKQLTDYIENRSLEMENTTWRDYAWRTKMITVKKILTLYIANGCQWEEAFEEFFWYSFHYSMWCKMNLFYEQATQDFQKESIVATRQVKTVFDYLPETFTRKQFQDAIQKAGYKSDSANMLCTFKRRGKIVKNDDDTYSIV